MKRYVSGLGLFFSVMMVISLITGCGSGNRDAGKVLTVEEVDPANTPGAGTGGSGTGGSTPGTGDSGTGGVTDGTLHPIFSRALGVPISNTSSGIIDPDPTGHTVNTDYDGDGIPNDHEIVSNPYVADYPRIVTRISAPITMEIRVSYSSVQDNHTETIEETGVEDTIKNSMEDRQYTQANQKTTPYVSKESYEKSGSHSESYGYENKFAVSTNVEVNIAAFGGGGGGSLSMSRSENESVADSFSEAKMSEKTVFEDVDYIDNLDRNGVEFTNDTVEKISQNFRKSETLKNTQNIGPNDGVVRAALFLKNMTVNMPVKVSNVICTLSFRTPAGEFLPVKTFKLRNEDYSEFNQSIYGNEELGPYTIEVANLNTYEVMKALENGYIPQIHVVSYDMHRVEDSNYNPGVENLKIVEETAKGRTALIKIVGTNLRETYRVAAFDVIEDPNNPNTGSLVPGISLKKALFNILKSRTGGGEDWNENPLTVEDDGLRWRQGSPDPENHVFTPNITGNSWDNFETYIKTYTDEYNEPYKIETIKRIGELSKYNPFNPEDNASYDPNELLSISEINKMKYWVIYHNGHYFTGDINDPIWAGERYEIVCVDIQDFNRHFEDYYYTPIQSSEYFYLNTRWNRLSNSGEFARALYLGKVVKGDVINLEINLMESRFLFNDRSGTFDGRFEPLTDDQGNDYYAWYDLNYSFQPESMPPQGIPKTFSHVLEGKGNRIDLNINNSELAHKYRIMIRRVEDELGNAVDEEIGTTEVTADDLKKRGNRVVLNRLTSDENGDPFGELLPGRYRVRVYAVGYSYGVEVTTQSATNSTPDAYIPVVNTPDTSPSSFSFKTMGLRNKLIVNISERVLNTEYFIIRITGPYNYYTAPFPVREVVGYEGMNEIPVANPTGEIVDPGVYSIEVFAVNRNSFVGDAVDYSLTTEATTQNQYVNISYDKYIDQKVHQPYISQSLFDLKALDLEVNFNDGTGWYRLVFESTDTGNTIDCRHTSYIDHKDQKFHVNFKAPAGPDDILSSIYNVFAGGREVTDVYIRTVAENRYRDTFWLKKQDGDYTSGMNSINIPGNINFISSWVQNENTDASLFDQSVSDFAYTGDLGALPFALQSTGKSDFFFSPLEERLLRVKATLKDTLVISPVLEIDEPTYNVENGPNNTPGMYTLRVTDIRSQYGTTFEIFFRPGTKLNGFEDVKQSPWQSAGIVAAEPDVPYNLEITGLIPNTEYLIAVVAYGEYGESKVAYYGDHIDTPNIAEADPVLVFSTAVPPEPLSINTALVDNDTAVLISEIIVPGEYRYTVSWKGSHETEWHRAIIESVNIDTPLSYTIHGLEPWVEYSIEVSALTRSGIEGEPYTATVMTQPYITTPVNLYANWSDRNVLGGGSYETANIWLFPQELPENTTAYSIDYTLTSDTARVTGDTITDQKPFPFSFSGTTSWMNVYTPVVINLRDMYYGLSQSQRQTFAPNYWDTPTAGGINGNYYWYYTRANVTPDMGLVWLDYTDYRKFYFMNMGITATVSIRNAQGDIVALNPVLVSVPELAPVFNNSDDISYNSIYLNTRWSDINTFSGYQTANISIFPQNLPDGANTYSITYILTSDTARVTGDTITDQKPFPFSFNGTTSWMNVDTPVVINLRDLYYGLSQSQRQTFAPNYWDTPTAGGLNGNYYYYYSRLNVTPDMGLIWLDYTDYRKYYFMNVVIRASITVRDVNNNVIKRIGPVIYKLPELEPNM